MPCRHPEEIGYGYVIERCVTRKDSDHPRHRVLQRLHLLKGGMHNGPDSHGSTKRHSRSPAR